MQNIIEIELFNKLFTSIAEEMGIVLAKSSFSPNIKERHDFSCAVFDAGGELVAQAAHIPVHLGSMPQTLSAVLASISFQSGDVVITNDPFQGGSHLPDITLIEGVFDHDSLLFYVVNRAHHADVGGRFPGSMGLSSSISEEGLLIPPTRLYSRGEINHTFMSHFLSEVRNPEERRGDLRAQTASLSRGRTRLLELTARHGIDSLDSILDALKQYAERLMRHTISQIPNGIYTFTDYLDNDGRDRNPLPLTVQLHIKDDLAVADFSKSADQVSTPLNTVESVTRSAVLYAFQCLKGDGYPVNQGSHRPLQIITRPGSILNARPPAPVAAGNVETSQRLVDVLFGALAQALPVVIPAASCGSMNNVTIGNHSGDKNEFSYYETIGGGMGGRPGSAGLSAIHTHMTNTKNTPIEALEHAYPFRIGRYAIRKASGGKGLFNGGEGIIRTYHFQETCAVSLLTERRTLSPYGLAGGSPAATGQNILVRKGKKKNLKGKTNFTAEPDDLLVIKTPGGGGWGKQ